MDKEFFGFCKLGFVFFILFFSLFSGVFIDLSSSKVSSVSNILGSGFSDPGIYNSEGFHSVSINSVNLQNAIDQLSYDAGTVWVNGDLTLTNTIIPRRNCIINFLGNNINVESNCPVFSFNNGCFHSVVKGANINLPSGYDSSVILFDNYIFGGWQYAMNFNNVENICINGDSSRNYVGIHLRIDGINLMWNNIFRNIRIYNPGIGILLEMTDDAVAPGDEESGWSNGHAFDNVLIDSFREGIKFIRPDGFKDAGFNCNYFNNNVLNYCSDSINGVTGVFANANTFMKISMNGWESFSSVDKVFSIDSKCDGARLYVDTWLNDDSRFEIETGGNVELIETGCSADGFQLEYDYNLLDEDFNFRGVYNSNKNFWNDASSSSIQAAIDDLGGAGGLVVVNKDASFSQPVYMKSNVKLDFLGYKLFVSDSDAFIFEPSTRNAVLKNIYANNPYFNNRYIFFDSSGDGEDDKIRDNLVENFIMTGSHYKAVHIKLDGLTGVWANVFRDIHHWGGDGILLEMTDAAVGDNCFGWANGNIFEYICNNDFYKGIIFDIPDSITTSDKAGFNCNLFKNIEYQIEPMTLDIHRGVSGDKNTFMHCIIWDDFYGNVNYHYEITPKAKNTKIWAYWDYNDDKYSDQGENTLIESGCPFFNPQAYNWDVSNNQPPYVPSNPDPENNSNDIDIDIVLSWEGGDPDSSDTVLYDVFFGTGPQLSDDDKISEDQDSLYYDFLDDLEYNTDYFWKIVSEDNHNQKSIGPIWTFKTRDQNHAPNPPNINGPNEGVIGQKYEYIISSDDPDGDNIYYYVEWDDDTNTGWLGPYNSGEEIRLNHTWTDKKYYTISAKVKDEYDLESSTTTLNVNIPKTKKLGYNSIIDLFRDILVKIFLILNIFK